MSTAAIRPNSSSATASAADRPAFSALFIDGPFKDFLLYVGTPLLVIPSIFLAWKHLEPATIYLFVAAFGALGHHLPGMMRAYGDTALFRRFRLRFVVAPIFLLTVCFGFAFWDMTPILLVTFGWGVWHGAMQLHGMLRIYDAKVGSVQRLTARLDHLMVLSWFGAGIFFSSTRVHYILEGLYGSGMPVIAPGAVTAVRVGWAALTIGVTAAFLLNLWRRWRAGVPPSPIKLVLLSLTIATWLIANVAIHHLLIGIVVFEIVHDVQYLGIVWRFNRNRAEKDPNAGSFTRFVFRRSWLMLGVYVGLIAAYGSLRLVQERLAAEAVLAAGLGAILAASALLHFYYDGFIWKMRERETRATLGLDRGEAAGGQGALAAARAGMPPWARHGLKWAFFVVPLALLTVGRLGGPVSSAEAASSIAHVVPHSVPAQYNLAIALHDEGDHAGELEALRAARALGSYDGEFDKRIAVNLSWALVEASDAARGAGDVATADARLAEAASIHPNLVGGLHQEATQAMDARDLALAERRLRDVLVLSADDVEGHYRLALVLTAAGRTDEALVHAARFQELAPSDPRAPQVVDRVRRGS